MCRRKKYYSAERQSEEKWPTRTGRFKRKEKRQKTSSEQTKTDTHTQTDTNKKHLKQIEHSKLLNIKG